MQRDVYTAPPKLVAVATQTLFFHREDRATQTISQSPQSKEKEMSNKWAKKRDTVKVNEIYVSPHQSSSPSLQFSLSSMSKEMKKTYLSPTPLESFAKFSSSRRNQEELTVAPLSSQLLSSSPINSGTLFSPQPSDAAGVNRLTAVDAGDSAAFSKYSAIEARLTERPPNQKTMMSASERGNRDSVFLSWMGDHDESDSSQPSSRNQSYTGHARGVETSHSSISRRLSRTPITSYKEPSLRTKMRRPR